MMFNIESFKQSRLHYNVDVLIIRSGVPILVVRFITPEVAV